MQVKQLKKTGKERTQNHKKTLLFLTIALFFTLIPCFSKGAKKTLPYIMKEFKVDNVNRVTGYQLLDEGKMVAFVFDASLYNIEKLKRVYLSGSFNDWSKTNTAWALDNYRGSIWTLICNTEDILRPGDSGYPEFKFYAIYEVNYIETICGQEIPKVREDRVLLESKSKRAGFTVDRAALVLFLPEEIETVKEYNKVKNSVKPLNKFNQKRLEDTNALTNFRALLGTKTPCLYRGYHPYKRTLDQATEKTRIRLTNARLESLGIKSIITLTGNEQANPKKEPISSYIQNINYSGNRLFTDIPFETVYYASGSAYFASEMESIIKFIVEKPLPLYIHCHFGIDQTGVVSAVLEALLGISWDKIAEDYEESNKMFIGKKKSARLLSYSFCQMLGEDPSKIENLSERVAAHLCENSSLTPADIKAFIEKVSTPPSPSSTPSTPPSTPSSTPSESMQEKEA